MSKHRFFLLAFAGLAACTGPSDFDATDTETEDAISIKDEGDDGSPSGTDTDTDVDADTDADVDVDVDIDADSDVDADSEVGLLRVVSNLLQGTVQRPNRIEDILEADQDAALLRVAKDPDDLGVVGPGVGIIEPEAGRMKNHRLGADPRREIDFVAQMDRVPGQVCLSDVDRDEAGVRARVDQVLHLARARGRLVQGLRGPELHPEIAANAKDGADRVTKGRPPVP